MTKIFPAALAACSLALLSAATVFGQFADRYALVLADPPVTAHFASREALQSGEASAYRQQIEAAQSGLVRELESRHFHVTGSNSILVNAVFVGATPAQAGELAGLPGVLGVVRLHKYQRNLNQATQLLNSAAAWTLLGGAANAGKGIKIGILDTGIDQNHPALQDNALTVPAGFPKCDTPANCANFTNKKVIVARSYVKLLALGGATINPATSRADDYSARDRVGHGTAVATCAAGNPGADTTLATVPINGMAPKAWLGSYKIFGSPEVNDGSTGDVLIAALTDAIADGMDMVSVSLGSTPLTGPLDTGAACAQAAGVPCDIAATAFEAAAKAGMLIIVSGGNAGPNFNTTSSPSNAPSVLAIGATSNSHGFLPAVRVTGPNVPASLALIPAEPGDVVDPTFGASQAPLVDVASLGNDGFACTALPAGSLYGRTAFIERSPAGATSCDFVTKMTNAVNAGATGVIFYDFPNSGDYPFTPDQLFNFTQHAVAIANADGVNLKAFLAANPGYPVIIDPSGSDAPVTPFNQVVFYSSAGPSLGLNAIKPDLLAVGGGGFNGDFIYMGAQNYDPLGDLYSATGYLSAAGSSFAAPLAAGTAALVKQNHPGWTSAQIRSALINTASQDVVTDDSDQAVSVLQTGAGKVAADLAVRTNITVVPSTLSFGAPAVGTLPKSLSFTVTNTGTASVALTLAAVASVASPAAKVALDKSSLSLAAGGSAVVAATLSGTGPAAGLYYGAITVAGGSVALRIPYLFLAGSTNAAAFNPLLGGGNDVVVGQPLPDQFVAFQITDANGVPIAGTAVAFAVNADSVPMTLTGVSAVTDSYGVARATVSAGGTPGAYSIEGCLGPCSRGNQFEQAFTGNVRSALTICKPGDPRPCDGVNLGVTNAALANAGAPVAPGSYISIYGTGLSDATDVTTTARLPMAIDFVNVSFDVPSAGISAPAHLVFVSNGQINAQVPWELQGQTSAQVKVTLGNNYSNVVTIPLANAAPALFEIGAGVVAAIDPLNAANPVITASNPAKRGKPIAVYANGLGPVSNQPASGETASLTALAQTPALPVVTIGGQPAPVAFSGLTPGLPGLYQINVTVPSNIAAGNQPVIVTIGGATSKASAIAVQ